MIEVERKFIVQPEELARLTEGAVLEKSASHTDIYYDKKDFDLTKRSIWLRARDDQWELKLPIGTFKEKGQFTRYDEIEDTAKIAEKLNISWDGGTPFVRVLESAGYIPFAKIATKRTKYRKQDISIDIDATDYGYNILEIEVMVEKESDIADAYKKIVSFAEARGITIAPVQARGKVIEYIRRTNPEHFNALEKAWGMQL